MRKYLNWMIYLSLGERKLFGEVHRETLKWKYLWKERVLDRKFMFFLRNSIPWFFKNLISYKTDFLTFLCILLGEDKKFLPKKKIFLQSKKCIQCEDKGKSYWKTFEIEMNLQKISSRFSKEIWISHQKKRNHLRDIFVFWKETNADKFIRKAKFSKKNSSEKRKKILLISQNA